MRGWRPEKVFIEKGSLDHRLAGEILAGLEGIPAVTVRGAGEVAEDLRLFKDPVSTGKRWLFLALRRGPFIKPCPCTPGHVNCGYYVVNLELNCPLDCSYCVLQHYLDHPLVTVHVNRDGLRQELDRITARRKTGFLRMGSGELGDSLALDHLTGSSPGLVDLFRGRTNAFFEFKTKTANIGNLLGCEPSPNVVVSWSLNAEGPARLEEKGAATVGERIEAARVLAGRGFPVGFHFDPLLFDPEDRGDGYRDVVRRMLKAVDPGKIAWISLGGLRFNPALKPVIRSRHPGSRALTGGEFIRGRDGKLRYSRPDRALLYGKMLGWIRESGGAEIPVYLCMESGDMWERIIGNENGERKLAVSSFPRPILNRNQRCVWA